MLRFCGGNLSFLSVGIPVFCSRFLSLTVIFRLCPVMSATLALPSELWLIIFQLAAHKSIGTNNTSPLRPLTDCPRSWDDHGSPWDSQTKVESRHVLWTTVRVSRLWNRLTLPLLYESIHIESADTLSLMASALNNPRIVAHGTPDPTWYTLRLEIVYQVLDGSPDVRDVGTLLALSPRLKVLHISTGHDWRLSSLTLVPILHTMGSTLRHLRWKACPPHDTLLTWLQSFPFLEVLEIHSDSSITPFFRVTDQAVSLPCLHTLIVYRWTGVVTMLDMPALTRMILRVRYPLQLIPDQHPIFDSVGPQITHLDLTGSGNPHMSCLLSRCTNLVELSISAMVFNRQAYDDVVPALGRVSVTLDLYDGQPASMTIEQFGACMAALFAMQLPELKVVRIADMDDGRIEMHVKPFPEVEMKVKESIEKWDERGVTLEDASGCLLSKHLVFQ
jgi:hypothetical protein